MNLKISLVNSQITGRPFETTVLYVNGFVQLKYVEECH